MEIPEAFGLVLRELREGANFTQEGLAYECDIDRTYVGLLERGRRQPTLTTIFKIAHVLKIKPSEIVRFVENKLNINSDDE